jgi:hypothetical protein
MSTTRTVVGILVFLLCALCSYPARSQCPPITLSYEIPNTTPPKGELPEGVINQFYGYTITAKGGQGPYTYAVGANNRLPQGLSLDRQTGKITGRPTVFGKFTVSLMATDANQCKKMILYTLCITNPNAPSTFRLEYETPNSRPAKGQLPPGMVGGSYRRFVEARGGAPEYSYVVDCCADLPRGLSLHKEAGEISGTPTASGRFSFIIKAKDAKQYTKRVIYDVRIFAITVPTITKTREIQGPPKKIEITAQDKESGIVSWWVQVNNCKVYLGTELVTGETHTLGDVKTGGSTQPLMLVAVKENQSKPSSVTIGALNWVSERATETFSF